MSKKQIGKFDVDQDSIKFVKKKHKHVILKVLLVVIVFLLLLIGVYFIKMNIEQARSKKMADEVREIQKNKTDYVFIDINPSFVLTIKEDKVTNVACLNEDCISIYNDIDVKGKSINDSINSLYTLSKDKGFDTSNGVSVRTTKYFTTDNKEQVRVEIINETTKDELLTNLKNNEDIKNNGNDDYYATLWDKLKKDSDYGKIYTCSMNNKELECYFIIEAVTLPSDNIPVIIDRSNKIVNTFNKFNIKNTYNISEDAVVYINDIGYELIGDWTYAQGSTSNGVNTSHKLIEEKMVLVRDMGMMEHRINENSYYKVQTFNYILLKDLNLLNPVTSKVNVFPTTQDVFS